MDAQISVPGLPDSNKVPGTYAHITYGAGVQTAGSQEVTIAILANLIPADLTGATPAFTVTKGSAPLATVRRVNSTSQAIDNFGRGSEAHLACEAAFAQFPNATLYVCPAGEAAGATAATATITAANASTITKDVTIRVMCGHRLAEINIASGSSTTAIGLAIAQAINDRGDFPFTAQSAFSTPTATVTLTWKNVGTRGNKGRLRVDVIDAQANTYQLRTGALTRAIGGTTFGIGAQEFSGATGTETTTVTTALNALASDRYNRVTMSMIDATNVSALLTHLVQQSATMVGKFEQGVVANVDDFDTANTGSKAIALANNDPLLQVVALYKADNTPAEIAAQHTTARVFGDRAIGGAYDGEQTKASANLDNVRLATIVVQELDTDRPLVQELNGALQAGVTPLMPSPSRKGAVCICRSITSRFKDGTGAINYGVLDTSEVTVVQYVADYIRAALSSAYAGFDIADDNADGNGPTGTKVTTPNAMRTFVLAQLKFLERTVQIIDSVDLLADRLIVQRSNVNRWQVNMIVPVSPIANLHVIGTEFQQLHYDQTLAQAA